MKQKVTVRAYIKQEGKVLLIKRATGNETLRNKFELPGGKIEHGEQPHEALKRELQEELSVEIDVAQLYDTVTYIDHDDRDAHHVVIVYQVSLAPHARTIHLSEDHSKYIWKKLSEIHLIELTEVTQLILDVNKSDYPTEVTPSTVPNNIDLKTSYSCVVIYSDGGSRGNPGPSAAGYVIMDLREKVLFEGGEYLGITTNNQAEYQAVCLGLERARTLGARVVDFRMDSLLVVNQLAGIYQIKNRELWPVHARIKSLVDSFEKVTFKHVKREFNQLADGIVNRVLDENAVEQKIP